MSVQQALRISPSSQTLTTSDRSAGEYLRELAYSRDGVVRSIASDPMEAAYQAPPSMGFSRQEYWSGVPLPSLKKGHKGD